MNWQTRWLGLGGKPVSASGGYDLPVREPEVVSPVDMIAIGDGYGGTTDGKVERTVLTIEREIPRPRPPNFVDYGTPAARRLHQGRLSVAFCDGHVESPKIEKLFFERTEASLKRWNRDNEPHFERLK